MSLERFTQAYLVHVQKQDLSYRLFVPRIEALQEFRFTPMDDVLLRWYGIEQYLLEGNNSVLRRKR